MATAAPTGCSWSPWAFLGLSQQKAEASRTTLEALAVGMAAGAILTNQLLGGGVKTMRRLLTGQGLEIAQSLLAQAEGAGCWR
jgi:hypothetical protein